MAHDCVRARVRDRQRPKIGPSVLDQVAVAHPDRQFPIQAFGKFIVGRQATSRGTELPFATLSDSSAQRLADQLHTVADPQDRKAQFQDFRVAARRRGLVDALRPAGKDDPPGTMLEDLLRSDVVSNYLAKYVPFADSAGNQLRVLRTEIEHHDTVSTDVHWAEGGFVTASGGCGHAVNISAPHCCCLVPGVIGIYNLRNEDPTDE
jgi:hypothetical protein